MHIPRPLAAIGIGLMALGAIVVPASHASANGEVFTVMNTSESPPDGVYFRDSPSTADTRRITGLGVYMSEQVSVDCYLSGDAVGSYGNTVWYYVTDVSRPTAPNGEANIGWINTHYVNDGMTANHPYPSVTSCAATPPPPPPPPPAPTPGGSVYFSPFNDDNIRNPLFPRIVPSVASATMYKQDWLSSVKCSTDRANTFPDVANNRMITTLSGWSLGRMGPIYVLKDSPRRANIHYVLLFDPGSLSELKSDCYSSSISQVLENWLQSNPQNRLAIMAGAVTRDYGTRVGAYAHQGLQQVYFPKIRGTAQASQVTVCNYDAMSHPDVWIQFQNYQNLSPVEDLFCPAAPNRTVPNAAWHP